MVDAQVPKGGLDGEGTEQLVHVVVRGHVDDERRRERTARPRTSMIDENVAGDDVEPRSQCSARRVVAIGALPSAQQGLLHEVFRLAAVAEALGDEGSQL